MRDAGIMLLGFGIGMIGGPLAVSACLLLLHRQPLPDLPILDLTGNVLMITGNVMLREWVWVIVFVVLLIARLLLEWRRRKRKRAIAAIGAKSRARIAAIVRTARERAQPRPVLRPQRIPA